MKKTQTMNAKYKKPKMSKLIKKILKWADNKGILAGSDPKTQALKCVSEVGELCDNVAKGNTEATRDDLGDTVVTLIILAELLGHDLTECVAEAYAEIANRKGKMQNGTFVKEESK